MDLLRRKYTKQRLSGLLLVIAGFIYCALTCTGVETIKDFTPMAIYLPAGFFLMFTKGVYIC